MNFGRFVVERRLGSGGFATVWLARDPLIDTQVAIKVLADNWSDDEETRRRFLAEARTLWNAESERIVRVMHIDELEDGRPYFAMSFADRGTLRDRMDTNGLPFAAPAALSIAAEICRAIEDVHQLGALHRDIKPGNVLIQSVGPGRSPRIEGLEPDERLLLADFGLVRDNDQADMSIVAGTPTYVAPEQARGGGSIDGRADIFSAGVIAYELLTGTLPYERRNMVDAAFTSAETPYERPSRIVSILPASVDSVIASGLHPAIDSRYATAAQFAEALEGALGDGTRSLQTVLSGPPSLESAGPVATKPATRGRFALIAVAAAVVVAIVAAALMARGGPENPGIATTSEATATVETETPGATAAPSALDPTAPAAPAPTPTPAPEDPPPPPAAVAIADLRQCPPAVELDVRPFLTRDELPPIKGRAFNIPLPEIARAKDIGGAGGVNVAGERVRIDFLVAQTVDEVLDFYRSTTGDLWGIEGAGPTFTAENDGVFACVRVELAAASTGNRVSRIIVDLAVVGD